MSFQRMDADTAEWLAGVVRLLRRAAELVWVAADADADTPNARGQVMHTLCGRTRDAVALGAYVVDLQHRLKVATCRRKPMADRPTALEITAAQGVIARVAGFEQLAASYMFGQPPSSAGPGLLRAAARAIRLETAFAAWEVQAHRTLAANLDPADLVQVARMQAFITSTTGILTEAAARKGPPWSRRFISAWSRRSTSPTSYATPRPTTAASPLQRASSA